VGTVAAELLGRGYKQEDIIVLSLRGLKTARLGSVERCGNQTLRRPTGTYDLFGNQLWTPGKLRFDTIRRYKGQQDAAVILTDVDAPEDPERMDEWERLMFASLTRATDRVEIVASGATADRLAGV
jgi:superfamily I DNA and RNA helicase